MLERLTLIRHAKAVPGTLTEADKARALTPQGTKDAYNLGTVLRRRDFTADVILCSTAVRTRETLTHITGGYEKPIAPVQYLDTLYHASAERILEVAELCGEKYVVIIGHNPGISDLATRLAGQTEQLPKGFEPGHFATASCASFNILTKEFDWFLPPQHMLEVDRQYYE